MTRVSRSARRGGAASVAALVMGLSACSAAAAPPSAGVAVQDGSAGALDFAGTTLDGGTLDVATLEGTPVALWFWAPWCTICRAEASDVAAVAAEFAGRVRVLGVPGRGEVDAMQGFVADTGTGAITHVVDPDGSLWNRFGVVTQPAFVFVDRDGNAESFAGSLGGERLREMLTALA